MITQTDIEMYANYLLSNNATIRATADYFDLKKSTLHNYLHKIKDKKLQHKVNIFLKLNFQTKYIKGGEATKQKFKKLKSTP